MFSDISRKYDQTFLKVFGIGENKKILLVKCRSVKTKGLEGGISARVSARGVNSEKLSANILRAKNNIFELSMSNHWDFFATLTLDKKKFNREDIKKFSLAFSRFLRDTYIRKGYNVKYLLVPELHSDNKSWHLHGFISGLPESAVCQFVIGQKMGKYIAEKVIAGEKVFNWPAYAQKFGFCDLEIVKNPEAVSAYMEKYIDKHLFENKSRFGCYIYYCSKGLNRAQVVCSGSFDDAGIKYDFVNEYVSKKKFDYSPELLDCLKNQFFNIDYHKTHSLALFPRMQVRARRARRGLLSECARVSARVSAFCSESKMFRLKKVKINS